MKPPHLDGGVEPWGVFLYVSKESIGTLPNDAEDVVLEVTVPYLKHLDAE
jgi:hypothetical protein